MRHGKRINHLSRTSEHRKAMLSNMAGSLIKHKRIKTTIAKAKALRKYVEPLLTKAKTDTTHSRRIVFKYLKDKHVVSELFNEVSRKISNRPGGYTRILKAGYRYGDSAELCYIELVDYNESLLKSGEVDTTKKKRTRRGAKKVDEKSEPKEEKKVSKKEELDVKDETKEESSKKKKSEEVDEVDEIDEIDEKNEE